MGQMDQTHPSLASTLLALVGIGAGVVLGLGVLWYVAPVFAAGLTGGLLVIMGALIFTIGHNHAHALDESRRERATPGRVNDDTARIVQIVAQALKDGGGQFVLPPPPVYTDRRNGHRVEGTDWYE